MEWGAQHARVEVQAPARAVLRSLSVGVLVTSVPASRGLLTAVESVVARTVDVPRVRPPPSRSTQVIAAGSVTEIVALPLVSDERLKGVAA